MKRLVLTLPLALAACASLPRPFAGNPGTEAERLSLPAAPVLIVSTPTKAALPPKAAALFAQDLAAALVNNDVPSVAGPVEPGQWRLAIIATHANGQEGPRYGIFGPDQKLYGTLNGTAAPAALWESGDAATLQTAANTDATALAHKLATINATVQESSPDSLENRTPRVYLAPITGAPGDGDTSLATNMHRDLPSPDLTLVKDPAQADFVVTGTIIATPQTPALDLVELDWVVTDTNHRKVGQVTQLHPLAPSDMEPFWGDVAVAAAQEAAGGVQEVIQRAVLHKGAQPSSTQPVPSAASPASP